MSLSRLAYMTLVLACLCLGSMFATISGQPSNPTSHVGEVVLSGQPDTLRDTTRPPVSFWDSLYTKQHYEELQEAIAQWHGAPLPVVRLFRGMLAHVRNEPERAIGALVPLVDSLTTVTPGQWAAGIDALAESYCAVYRYREAAETYRAALRQARRLRHPPLDSTVRGRWQQQAMFAETLRNVLPQSVMWHAAANRDTLANDGIRYAARVRINGDSVGHLLRVDLRTTVTILDSTTAAASGIQILTDSLLVATDTGAITRVRVGVIPTLTVGTARVSNVPVLVFGDRVLHTITGDADTRDSSMQTAPPVVGIIGLPVLNALGRVTFTTDGHIALSSPGVLVAAPQDTSSTTTPNIRVAFESVRDTNPIGRIPGGAFPLTVVPIGIVGSSGVSHRTRLLGTDLVRTVRAIVSNDISDTSDAPPPTRTYRDADRPLQSVTVDFSTMALTVQQPQPPPVLPTITYPGDISPKGTQDTPAPLPEDLTFVALLFALFVIPKALQRYRIPSAITSLLMGILASRFGLFQHDPTLHLLSTFGIVALFLFAGLEIDSRALRHHASSLLTHSLIWSGLVAVTAGIAVIGYGLAIRPGLLIGLALMTPSTGFILSSLAGFGLHESEQATVKTYAIGSELLALGVLFFVLQSTSVEQLAFSLAAIIGVVIVIPLAFRAFATIVAPHAPRSEFAFLLMVAVVSAYATRRLGVYYLVGAFLVGVAAQRFRADHPAMSSERMVDALESFGSVFIPFYFFRAGTQIVSDQLTPMAIGVGVLFALLCIPARVLVVTVQRRYTLRESFRKAQRIGSAMIPTLVFTLVLADILHTQFAIADTVVGALVLYTILNTSFPAFLLHGSPPEFEHVEASVVEETEFVP